MEREKVLQLAEELETLGKATSLGKALSERCFQSYVLRALATALRLLVKRQQT